MGVSEKPAVSRPSIIMGIAASGECKAARARHLVRRARYPRHNLENQMDMRPVRSESAVPASWRDGGRGGYRRLADVPTSVIVFEDDELYCVDKPPDFRMVGDFDVTLEKFLGGGVYFPHRLDFATSGLQMVCKNPKTTGDCTRLMMAKTWRKAYLACVVGQPDFSECDVVGHEYAFGDAVLKPPPTGECYECVGFVGTRDPEDFRMAWEKEAPATGYFRAARTIITVVARTDDKTILWMRPLTGRRHQLRLVAAFSLRSPILGDATYAAEDDSPRMYLHSMFLRVPFSQLGKSRKLQRKGGPPRSDVVCLCFPRTFGGVDLSQLFEEVCAQADPEWVVVR